MASLVAGVAMALGQSDAPEPSLPRPGSIVVLDPGGRTSAVVNEAAVQATPEDRRPWLPVSAVARTLEPGLSLPVDIAGEQLIRAMQRTPASEYLLLDPDGSLFGVLVTEDVDRAFSATT